MSGITTEFSKPSIWNIINPYREISGACKVEKFIKSRGFKIFCVVAAVSVTAVFCPHVAVGLAGLFVIKALFAKIIIAAAPAAISGACSLASYIKRKFFPIMPLPKGSSSELVYNGL
jgi:hypothetical protein